LPDGSALKRIKSSHVPAQLAVSAKTDESATQSPFRAADKSDEVSRSPLILFAIRAQSRGGSNLPQAKLSEIQADFSASELSLPLRTFSLAGGF
jgi:hypothetical protein